MAITNYTGWALNVNRIILDSTTISTGDNALVKDELENGLPRSRQRGSYCPDKYSVVMEFNWLDKDSNGNTEVQRFYEWYKYQHKYGAVPFEFPQILYSPQSGIIAEDEARNITRSEFYKITSAVEGSKRGSDLQMKMTWETVYSGVVEIATQDCEISSASGNKEYVDIILTMPSEGTAPVSSDFSISEDDTAVQIEGFYFNNSDKVRLYYTLSNATHNLTINYKDQSVEVQV